MKKLGALEQAIKEREKEISNTFQALLKELEENLKKKSSEILNTIEKDIKQQIKKCDLKSIYLRLDNIDWELEELRKRTRIIWFLTGSITTLISLIILLKMPLTQNYLIKIINWILE